MSLPDLVVYLLPVAFVTSTGAKALRPKGFVAFLGPLFGRRAAAVAYVTLALESLLAAGLLLPSSRQTAALASMAFVAAATGTVAVRYHRTGDSSCGCWGARTASTAPDARDTDPVIHIVRLSFLGVRNGLLMLLAAVQALLASPSALALFLVPCAIVGISQILASRHERAMLSLKRHPRARIFEPNLAPIVALSWYSPEYSGDGWGTGFTHRASSG